MKNGGGPACLRLRVVLTQEQLSKVHPGILFDLPLYERLVAWVKKHYRESLRADDLADPLLMRESMTALDELTGILGLSGSYPFQH
jgi:succinylarginine dihydrolase